MIDYLNARNNTLVRSAVLFASSRHSVKLASISPGSELGIHENWKNVDFTINVFRWWCICWAHTVACVFIGRGATAFGIPKILF